MIDAQKAEQSQQNALETLWSCVSESVRLYLKVGIYSFLFEMLWEDPLAKDLCKEWGNPKKPFSDWRIRSTLIDGLKSGKILKTWQNLFERKTYFPALLETLPAADFGWQRSRRYQLAPTEYTNQTHCLPNIRTSIEVLQQNCERDSRNSPLKSHRQYVDGQEP